MPERSLTSLTLREKFNDVERLARELIQHLEHGYIPKAHELRRTARHGCDPEHHDEVTDATIRNLVERVLVSDDYTRELCTRAQRYLEAVDHEVADILGNT
ncbi:hypothetical protein [Maioricimonas sp. JC845]|uniref:hypothetical protein n=1 Tax=Maioricimonas sp. JC845 TaxID=3232138 RepID=UPI003459FDF6